jgi:hypothetical protein
VFNGTTQMLDAALAGFGLAYLPEDSVRSNIAKGRLFACSLIGVLPIRATTSTTRTGASQRWPSPCLWKRSITVNKGGLLDAGCAAQHGAYRRALRVALRRDYWSLHVAAVVAPRCGRRCAALRTSPPAVCARAT